jgi:hypothetical protein
VGYFTAKAKTYCMFYDPLGGLLLPFECTTNIWDTESWPVCAVDADNSCDRVLLLPRTTTETVQTCARLEAMLTGCVAYETSRDFVYKASLTGTGIVSQSALQQGDTSVWNVFMTTPPEQVMGP